MMTGVELIAQERERQITEEGWSSSHDDQHTNGELVDAAMCYLSAAPNDLLDDRMEFWPFEAHWFKPKESRLRELAVAGALIAAEMDRLTREAIGDATE